MSQKSGNNTEGKRFKYPNGTGHIEPYGHNMLRYRKQIGYKPDGKPDIVTGTGRTKAECIERFKKNLEKRKAKRQNEAFHKNISTDIKDYRVLTVTDLCYLHLEHDEKMPGTIESGGADRRECTIRNQIEPFPIGDLQVGSVDSSDVKRHIESLILNPKEWDSSTIEKALNVLNAAFRWSVTQGFLSKNPCDTVMVELRATLDNLDKKQSENDEIIILSDEEIQLLKHEALKKERNGKPKYFGGLGCILLLLTGMRVGELCALCIMDYIPATPESPPSLSISRTRHRIKDKKAKELGSKTKVVEENVKTRKPRIIALSPEADQIVLAMINALPNQDPETHLVLNSVGKPSDPTGFIRHLNIIYKNAGLGDDITAAHTLRKTYTTNEHFLGVPTDLIADYIGDTTETVRKHYMAKGQKIRAGDKVLSIVPNPADYRGITKVETVTKS